MKTIKFSIVLLALVFSKSLVQAHSFNAKTIPAVNHAQIAIQQVNRSGYKVVDSGALIIFQRERAGNKLNLFKPIITYYFSVKGSDKIYSLTLENLKNIFRDGQAFTILDTYFNNDDDLQSYDKTHHEFRVNYYLSQVNPA